VPSEYEGDGLVVVEAILAGAPILLRDNEDLRRFELPDSHYFRSQKELEEKIRYIRSHGLSKFYASSEIKEKLVQSRSAKEIKVKWINFLKIQSPNVASEK
jgi:glycosyltransferase involved in cell wall biosynthesis